MSRADRRRARAVSLARFTIDDAVWRPRLATNRTIILPRRARLRPTVDRALFGGVPVITGRAHRRDVAG